MFVYQDYVESARFIKEKLNGRKPKIAIILGSGLGTLIEEVKNKTVIRYDEIPNFPVSTVSGHAGELVIGELLNKEVIIMNGRTHYYEGYNLKQTTFPIRVFKLLGVDIVLITNAAGGINRNYTPGTFMIMNDYISFFADSVLRGPNIEEFGDRFIDMSRVFDEELSQLLKKTIQNKTRSVKEGVYAYMKGPVFQTPAEIRALRSLGADAVGMSSVPEAIVARHCGMRVVGISCITNMASGVTNEILTHEQIKKSAGRVKITFIDVIKEFMAKIKI